MSEQNYTLMDCVDQYLALRQIGNKKYVASYGVAARYAWRQLFQNTIFSTQSQWQPLRAGEPHDYIDVPKGMLRLFSVAEKDDCGNIVPLFYNNQLNVISKPTVNTCGCSACDCASTGFCEDVNNLTKTTKLLFSISGTDYYET